MVSQGLGAKGSLTGNACGSGRGYELKGSGSPSPPDVLLRGMSAVLPRGPWTWQHNAAPVCSPPSSVCRPLMVDQPHAGSLPERSEPIPAPRLLCVPRPTPEPGVQQGLRNAWPIPKSIWHPDLGSKHHPPIQRPGLLGEMAKFGDWDKCQMSICGPRKPDVLTE